MNGRCKTADGTVDDASLAVLRPDLPTLVPGETYLIETVVRTLGLGGNWWERRPAKPFCDPRQSQ